ncbi:MAG: aspartate ammonia-lyase, partial [Methanococcoides sp.]|nr:aspartate ammonia-lyase [Methanococcoides sp.]
HTAIHIAAVETMNAELMPALVDMLTVFSEKSAEFMDVVKPGRTHLQDAVPVTLGQEFSGYARMLELGIKRLERSVEGLQELNMGGTAVGTGLNIPENFSNIAIREVRAITGQDFSLTGNPFEATQAAEAILGASAALRSIAVSLIKIANDLRLLSSGPRTGIGEINLPAVQPGSSIMPGKVNPVMAEMLNMACFQIIGNDSAITMAAQGGQFELNVFTPLLAYDLLNSIEILTGATTSFTERCLRGITVNRDRCEELSKQSLALVTILATRIGYEEAANIAHIAHVGGKTIIETVKEMRIMDEKDAEELLDPLKMTGVKQ